MTLVVPCLHNMFMVLLNFALGNFKIGAMKPIFLEKNYPLSGEKKICMHEQNNAQTVTKMHIFSCCLPKAFIYFLLLLFFL